MIAMMMSSGTKAPADMYFSAFSADFGLGVAGGAEHVAGRQVRHLVGLDQPLGLGPFARARRTDEYHAHEWSLRIHCSTANEGLGIDE